MLSNQYLEHNTDTMTIGYGSYSLNNTFKVNSVKTQLSLKHSSNLLVSYKIKCILYMYSYSSNHSNNV